MTAFNINPRAPISSFAITSERSGGVLQPTHIPVVQGVVTAYIKPIRIGDLTRVRLAGRSGMRGPCPSGLGVQPIARYAIRKLSRLPTPQRRAWRVRIALALGAPAVQEGLRPRRISNPHLRTATDLSEGGHQSSAGRSGKPNRSAVDIGRHHRRLSYGHQRTELRPAARGKWGYFERASDALVMLVEVTVTNPLAWTGHQGHNPDRSPESTPDPWARRYTATSTCGSAKA